MRRAYCAPLYGRQSVPGSSAPPPRWTFSPNRVRSTISHSPALQAFGCDGAKQGILFLGDELPTFNIGQNQLCPAFSSHASACLCILKAHLPLDSNLHTISTGPDLEYPVLYAESTRQICLIADRIQESIVIQSLPARFRCANFAVVFGHKALKLINILILINRDQLSDKANYFLLNIFRLLKLYLDKFLFLKLLLRYFLFLKYFFFLKLLLRLDLILKLNR